MKLFAAGILVLLFFEGTAFCQDFWEPTSGPEGGWSRCIAVDKQNNIYAGFNSGQFGYTHKGNCLYKSRDNGLSWQSLEIPGNKDVESIVIDTTGTIFIWTGYSGAFKSTDEGFNWISISAGLDIYQDGNLAACLNNYIILGNNYGVYVSSDAGINWVLSPLIDPVHSLFVDSYDNIFAGIYYGGLYKSSDYGVTWSTSDNGLSGEVKEMMQMDDSTYFAGTNAGMFITSDRCSTWNLLNGSPAHISAVAKGLNNEIYAATLNDGFYISTNMGIDWYRRNNGLKNLYITNMASFYGNSVIIGTYGDGLFMSNSQGQSWQSINSGIKCIHSTAFLRYKQYLFTGSRQGMLYKSTDLGDSWTRFDSTYTYMPITAFLKTRNNSLFFASWEDPYGIKDNKPDRNSKSPSPRVFKSTDEGSSWNETAQIYVNSFEEYYDQNTGTEYLLAAADYMGIRLSVDDGNTWQAANNGIEGIIQDVGVSSSGTFFATVPNRIFRSTDFGKSWQIVYEHPDLSYRMIIAVSNNDYIYAGFDWGTYIIRSTDNGDSWAEVNVSLYGLNSITTDSLNRVYIGTRYGDIFQSFNYCQQLINISSGMIGGPIMNLECDNSGNIFTGPYGGSVYRGANNIFVPQQVSLAYPLPGANNVCLTPELKWQPSGNVDLYQAQVALVNNFDSSNIVFDFSTPDTSCIVDSLEINTRYYWRVRCSNQYGCSIWSQIRSFRTINPSLAEEDDQNIIYFELAQNYPNPFNPVTSIQYTLGSRQYVILKVYDVLGNEIETLVNEEKPAGTYELTWNAAALPSGVYFYRLRTLSTGRQAGLFTETKKMILLR